MLVQNLKRSDPDNGNITIDIPGRARAFPAALAVLILVGILASGFYGVSLFDRSHLVPAILAGICGLGALYTERWVFSRQEKVMVRQVGLMFFHFAREVAFAEIDRLVLSGMLVMVPIDRQVSRRKQRGTPSDTRVAWRSFASFFVETRTGRRYRIDQVRGRRAATTLAIAGQVSRLSGLPLDDRLSRIGGGPPGPKPRPVLSDLKT